MGTYAEYRRELWAGKAAAYDGSFAGLCVYPVPRLLDLVGAGPGVSLLDVGCGTGHLADQAASRGAAVWAVDAEPSMVAATVSRVPNATVSLGALPELTFLGASFDAVVSNFVINHVEEPARCVAELTRVTRAGGRVGVTVWPRPSPPLQQLWDDVVHATLTDPPQAPEIPAGNDFPRTEAGLAGLLEGAGLLDVRCEFISWEHRVDREQWWSGPANGIASIGYVVSRLDQPTVQRMKHRYHQMSARYRDDTGILTLPTSALIAVGTRPVG